MAARDIFGHKELETAHGEPIAFLHLTRKCGRIQQVKHIFRMSGFKSNTVNIFN